MKMFTSIVIAIVFAFGVSANAKVQKAVVPAKLESAKSAFDIRYDLLQTRRAILNGDSQTALYLVDKMLAQTGGGGGGYPTNFTRLGIVYSVNDAAFRCSSAQQRQAVEVAARAAINDCFNAGLRDCRISSSYLRVNGYIGSINGTFYGYGCVSEATAQGI